MITVQIIDESRKADIRLPNEPFALVGKLIPSFDGNCWGHRENQFPEQGEMCFPDEAYDYAEMAAEHIFVGAYDAGKCVGLAVLRRDMFKYLYIYDLKVNMAYRRNGIGCQLIRKAEEIALQNGYRGLYVHAQDNNLLACRFYLKAGFDIGGFDNRVYRGTNQEEKADITFYKDCC